LQDLQCARQQRLEFGKWQSGGRKARNDHIVHGAAGESGRQGTQRFSKSSANPIANDRVSKLARYREAKPRAWNCGVVGPGCLSRSYARLRFHDECRAHPPSASSNPKELGSMLQGCERH
jgi:hypothetical protein